MQQVKNARQKLYSAFMLALVALLLTACSDNSKAGTVVEKESKTTSTDQEAAVQDEQEMKDEIKVEETELKNENQATEEDQKDSTVLSTTEKTLTLHEFINRWNEMEPGRLSGETKTERVENGIVSGYGSIGLADTYIFQVNQNDNTIQGVALNLSYPLPEDEVEGLGDNIPNTIRVLMSVLEPELTEEEKEQMLSTLINRTTISEVSVKHRNVTYKTRYGDDRFWLDADFGQ